VRVWPTGALGEFAGELPLTDSGACRIEVTINDRVATGAIAVADRPLTGVERTLAKLERRATVSGGVVARAGEEDAIVRAIASQPSPAAAETTVHPMRVPWWMLPFAACLSAEWWLRRRSGLR
jgi:hypothetical protein